MLHVIFLCLVVTRKILFNRSVSRCGKTRPGTVAAKYAALLSGHEIGIRTSVLNVVRVPRYQCIGKEQKIIQKTRLEYGIDNGLNKYVCLTTYTGELSVIP